MSTIEKIKHLEDEIYLFRLLLNRRFGELPLSVEARIASASEAELTRWIKRLFDVPTLNDVLLDDVLLDKLQ